MSEAGFQLFPRSAKLVHPAAKNRLALGWSGLGPHIDLGANQAQTCFWASPVLH